MSNRLLKQEEIDALLNAPVQEQILPEEDARPYEERLLKETAGIEFIGEQSPTAKEEAKLAVEQSAVDLVLLSDEEKDALGEVGNICMGSSATTLSMLLNQPVNITSPSVTITTLEELFKGFVNPLMTIYVRFIEGLSGYNLLIMKLDDAAVLADLMMGGDGTSTSEELAEIGISAASEAMNQMIGSASTSMATMFSRTVNISPPETKVYYSSDELQPPDLGHQGPVVVVWFNMTIGSILDTKLMQVMDLATAREEAGLILGQLAETAEAPTKPFNTDIFESDHLKPKPAQVNGVLEESKGASRLEEEAGAENLTARPLAPLNLPGLDQRRLDLILDIPLKVSVLLGRTSWPIKDILGLTPGAVAELQSHVDEPVEVLINGTLVALGEVVVVNENFGVRITNIIRPEDRLQNLGK